MLKTIERRDRNGRSIYNSALESPSRRLRFGGLTRKLSEDVVRKLCHVCIAIGEAVHSILSDAQAASAEHICVLETIFCDEASGT